MTVLNASAPVCSGVPGRQLRMIVNPESASGRTRRAWPTIDRRLRRLGYDVSYQMTESVGDGTRIAARAILEGADEIVVVGGDGTLNEVVNGLFAATHGEPPDITVSILPAGSGRDFSRNLGIRSFDHALETLGNGELVQIDVGRIDHTDSEELRTNYFMNAADVGIGAETASVLARSGKLLGGKLSYLLGAARATFQFSAHPATVWLDGEVVHDGNLLMVCLSNGEVMAGGMRMAPGASLQDGLFDVLVLDDVSRASLLFSLLPSVYFGRHLSHPAVMHRQARVVEVTSPVPLLFETDGELPGTTDIKAMTMPAALRVRVPNGFQAARER